MKLHAVLSYFNESPSWLSACVASAARVCDHLIAVDGRYALYQDEMVVSPVEQCEALVETAAGAGLPLTLHRPAEPFYGNEVEKRNLTLKLAAAMAEPMKDWLLIIDADCLVIEHSPFLRHDLESCPQYAARVAVEETMDPLDEAAPLAIAHMTSLPDSWRSPVTLLFRVLHDMRYEGTHYSLSGNLSNGTKLWLWGHPQAEQPFDATHSLAIRHRNVLRPKYRREQAATYYRQRDKLGIEERPA